MDGLLGSLTEKETDSRGRARHQHEMLAEGHIYLQII